MWRSKFPINIQPVCPRDSSRVRRSSTDANCRETDPIGEARTVQATRARYGDSLGPGAFARGDSKLEAALCERRRGPPLAVVLTPIAPRERLRRAEHRAPH